MATVVVAATFQNITEADAIGIDIGVRVDQRMANACLRREVYNKGKPMLAKKRGGCRAGRGIAPHEFEILTAGELVQARLLQLWIVIGRQVIDTNHLAAALHQMARNMEADETGSAGDKDRIYKRHRSMSFGFCARSSLFFTSSTIPTPPFSRRATNGHPPAR